MAIRDQMKQLRYSRKHDKKGRSKRGERYVRLEHWLLKMPAWRALTPQARAVYVELEQRFNGTHPAKTALRAHSKAGSV